MNLRQYEPKAVPSKAVLIHTALLQQGFDYMDVPDPSILMYTKPEPNSSIIGLGIDTLGVRSGSVMVIPVLHGGDPNSSFWALGVLYGELEAQLGNPLDPDRGRNIWKIIERDIAKSPKLRFRYDGLWVEATAMDDPGPAILIRLQLRGDLRTEN